MREGSKQLQRLGFAALFMLAVSATQALGQGNPACGVPAALGDGWTIDSPESAGLDGVRLCDAALDMMANYILPSVRDNNTR